MFPPIKSIFFAVIGVIGITFSGTVWGLNLNETKPMIQFPSDGYCDSAEFCLGVAAPTGDGRFYILLGSLT